MVPWDSDKSTAADPDNPAADEQLTADEWDAHVSEGHFPADELNLGVDNGDPVLTDPQNADEVVLRYDRSAGSWVMDSLSAEQVSTNVEPRVTQTGTGLPGPHTERRGIDALQYTRPQSSVFAWVLDDGYASHHNNRATFENKNMAPTLAVRTQKQGTANHMTWDEIDELSDPKGSYQWEVASHGQTNSDLDTASESAKVDEIQGSMKDLRDKAAEYANGSLIPEHFVYPKAQDGGDVGKALVAHSGYLSGVGTSGGIMDQNRNLLKLPRQSADTKNKTTAELKTVVDNAISAGVGCVFLSHEIVDGTQSNTSGLETSTQKIKDIIDYVRNQGASWGSVSDVLQNHGGMFYVGGPDTNIHNTTDGRLNVNSGLTMTLASSSGPINLDPGSFDVKVSGRLFADTSGAGIGVLNAENLSGKTGNFNGEIRMDDGTNTAANMTPCTWDDTNSVWRPANDPSAGSFS